MITSITDQAAGALRAREARAAQAPGWSAGWAVSVAGAGLAIAAVFPEHFQQIALACAAMAAPTLPGLLMRREGQEALRTLLMVLWALGAAVACALAGGITGPLAVWCLAPIAAAAAYGGPRRMAEGAALAFMAAGLAGMAQLWGLTPPAPTGAEVWLALLALASTGLGLGAALILQQRGETAIRAAGQGQLAHFASLLDEMPVLALSLSADGHVEHAYGTAPEGIAVEAGQNLGALARLGDMTAVAEAVREAGFEGRAEVGFGPAGAEDRWVCGSLARLPDGRLAGVIRDATDERDRAAYLDRARQDAEQLAAGKARFLANMSHELRTPLNAIMGFADIMRARMFGPLPDKYAEYGALIHESGAHLLDLINDVLDMSKIEAAKYELTREFFDGREAVNAALRLMRVQADGAGIQLRGVLPPHPLPIDADRRALKQIVLNLVSNALKFTPKGGSVTVTAHGFDGVFELVVADNGVGISRKDLARIGRPYEQTDTGRKALGTGLGLSLVRAFAELHGGEMAVESDLGEGATVTIRMPVLHAVLPEPARPAAETFGENVVAFAPPR
ncbi:MAG TPA: HAMP domain-containing sensor histidine kinase [Caulobacteraceae bacterium]|nr:HAMP domain-containing sensor histidine kinase [Caulobacteraceae bacterium]